MGGSAIIGGMGAVLRKADRVRNLVRHVADDYRDADTVEQMDEAMVEIGNGLRLERQGSFLAAAGACDEPVPDKVEFDFEDFVAGRHR